VERADPSLIVIETTGVADPAPTAARVERAGLGVDAVITAVDAEAFEIGWRLGRVARRQVDAADFLVLTKTDLVDEARLVRLERRLGRRNPRARLVRSRGGRLASGAVFGLGLRSAGPHVAPAPALEAPAGAAHGGHLAADSVEHFAWTSAGAMEPAALEAFLARLPASVWRAKGFARVPGNPWSCLFNFTCGRYQLSWIKLEEPPPTQAVFIGRGLAGDIRRDIEAGLAALVAPVDPAGLHSGAARGGQAQADATDVCVTDTRGNTGAE
jgi:cobalamin biosynthesis protein CobW